MVVTAPLRRGQGGDGRAGAGGEPEAARATHSDVAAGLKRGRFEGMARLYVALRRSGGKGRKAPRMTSWGMRRKEGEGDDGEGSPTGED